MKAEPGATSTTVRIAALLFFFVCVPLSIWESNVQSKILVIQDPTATTNNLLANEFIFRTSIVSHIIGTVVFMLMVMMFYKTFRPFDKHLARLMVLPIIAQFAIVFVLEAFNFTALMILKGEARPTFDVVQQQEAAYFLLRIHRFTFGADKIIFGLFFIPFGILVFRSGVTPRFVAILFLAGGVGYAIDSLSYILLQREEYLTIRSFKLYSSALYALGLLWFLVKGIRVQQILNPKVDLQP